MLVISNDLIKEDRENRNYLGNILNQQNIKSYQTSTRFVIVAKRSDCIKIKYQIKNTQHPGREITHLDQSQTKAENKNFPEITKTQDNKISTTN